MTDLSCQDIRRRDLVRQRQRNGLDYLEVGDRQTQLRVYFLGPVPTNFLPLNLRITGGQVIRDIRVLALELVQQDDPTLDSYLRVTVDQAGDFSAYTLTVVALDDRGRPTDAPHPDFDPRYSALTFSFKVGCPSDLDCKTDTVCLPEGSPDAIASPGINYLAKDYASFRQMILDRLALLVPHWRDRHVPDLGITLVELLAYVGDYLSYYQDAVATEAYLDTARQRISVRRHARLVDYTMHEGCNARTWVQITLEGSESFDLDLTSTYFITAIANNPLDAATIITADLQNLPLSAYEVFEPMETGTGRLYQSHNQIEVYTWGDRQCCLPQGATQATLIDGWQPVETPIPIPGDDSCNDEPADPGPPWQRAQRRLHLQAGDILLLEEILGPRTGHPADADPQRRHLIYLTRVTPKIDDLRRMRDLERFDGPADTASWPIPLVEIEWTAADALPTAFCLSALGPNCELLTPVSVFRGNGVLVDHGCTQRDENLGTVGLRSPDLHCVAEGQPAPVTLEPAPFQPSLANGPLTFSQPMTTGANSGAKALLQQDPRQALPQIARLESQALPAASPPDPAEEDCQRSPVVETVGQNSSTWSPVFDLFASGPSDRHFVAEIDDQGQAHLRFGDGTQGHRPAADTTFVVAYRVGNGPAGNVGAETLAHIVLRDRLDGTTLTPRNPLPAVGGTAPEPLDDVRLFAPTATRHRLQRAITAQDYADIVLRDFAALVQRAAALLQWNGSWYEVLVAVDARGTGDPAPDLLDAIEAHLYRFRRIGHDLRVKGAIAVPLHIEMTICVSPDYSQGGVKAAVLDRLSDRPRANGELGFFHPDRLTFGKEVALSPLVAAVQAIEGVEAAQVTRFSRLYDDSPEALSSGFLPLGPLEIARLANNPSQPDQGELLLTMGGGR